MAISDRFEQFFEDKRQRGWQKAFSTGVLREWSVDKEHGDIIWEFEFHESNGNDVTVKVSNSTGQVLEIDR